MGAPRFLYFDLGNVLVFFDPQIAFDNLAQLAKTQSDQVQQFFASDNRQNDYECGRLSTRQFIDQFCDRFGVQADDAEFIDTAGSMFQLNLGLVPVVTQLAAANNRLGILSNTSEAHWQYCFNGRYTILRAAFEEFVLSYEVGTLKPDGRIYEVAAEKAGVAPGELFFVDDNAQNVEAACDFGVDAVRYTTVSDLVQALRERGVEFNY